MSAPNPAKAIGILMVLIGLGFGIYNYLKPSERDTLKKQDVSAVAMIVDKETTTTTYQMGSQRSESEKNVPKYTFPTETGQLIAAEKSVTFETLRLIQVGSSNFAVLYLPSDPSRHMSRADLRSPVPRQLLVAGGIIALYVIGLLLLAWYLGRRSRPLSFGGRLTLSLGVVAMLAGTTGGFLIYRDAAFLNEFDAGGTRVDAAVKGWGRRLVDNVWIHCFDYYFTDPEGFTHQGAAEVSREMYEAAEATGKARIPIVYLPQNPDRHLTLPKLADRSPLHILIAFAALAVVGFCALAVGLIRR